MIKRGASVHWDQCVLPEMFRWVSWGQLIFKNRTVSGAPRTFGNLVNKKTFLPYGGCLVLQDLRVGWGGGSAKWKRLGVSRRCSC